jgi:hypothetical protein
MVFLKRLRVRISGRLLSPFLPIISFLSHQYGGYLVPGRWQRWQTTHAGICGKFVKTNWGKMLSCGLPAHSLCQAAQAQGIISVLELNALERY